MGDEKRPAEKGLSEDERQMREKHRLLLRLQMVEMVMDLNLLGEEPAPLAAPKAKDNGKEATKK